MSHMQTLNSAKQVCDTTGHCNEYQALLQHEYSQIDSYTADAIQNNIVWGVVIAIIGLVVMLTPFIKSFQKFQAFLLPKLAIAAPVLIGLGGGASIGFAISFSACFKQSCSAAESLAIFIIPLATLIVTIPIARIIYKKRQAMSMSIARQYPQVWIIIGVIIIMLAATSTVTKVIENRQINEQQKQYLLESEF